MTRKPHWYAPIAFSAWNEQRPLLRLAAVKRILGKRIHALQSTLVLNEREVSAIVNKIERHRPG